MIVLARRSQNKRIHPKIKPLCFLLALSGAMLLHPFDGFGQASVSLAWNRSSSSGVAGYRVYYGAASRTYTNHLDTGTATNATIAGLKTGVSYFFAATGYSANGMESAYSSEVSYTPATTAAPSIALSSPANGAIYAAPANVSLAANVVTNGHTISKVQFFNGSTLLAEDTSPPYAFAWNGVAVGNYTLSAKVIYDAGTALSSGSASITVNPQSIPGLTFASTSGTISTPFIAANGTLYQTSETGVTTGGRAAYTVNIPAAGSYLVSAMVITPSAGANSFYVNFDGEPTDPTMIWDVPVTTTLTSENVSWRGTGTDAAAQFSPKAFTLSQGTHQLIIRGREANAQLGAITISPVTNAASPLIVLTSPSDGSTYQAPATLSVAATVTPNGHTITKVQMFNGSTLLAEDAVAPYTFTWTNVAAGNYSLMAKAVYDAGSTIASIPVSVTINAVVSSLTFASTSGTISSPFTVANGVVYQTTDTVVTSGGRAVYNFSVPTSGDYLVTAMVNAPSSSANSFYVNIDAEPVDPTMVWDMPATSGLASRTVSWRGNGTADVDQFTPKIFNLAQGTHQLIIRGREANTQLGTITVSPAAILPAPWQVIDIGNVAFTGNTSVTGGVYTVGGAGRLSGSSDSLRFLYQPMSGDGEIRARLMSLQNTSTNARAGIIARESLAPNSRYVFLGVSPDGAIRSQSRSSTAGSTSSTSSGSGTLPNIWMRLVRSNNTFNSYSSTDGANWVSVGSSSVAMATNIYFGFAVASGQTNLLNTSVFSTPTMVP